MSFWYRTTSTSSGLYPIGDHSQVPDTTAGYQIFLSAGGGDLAIWDDDASNHLVSGQGLVHMGDGNWHHVAASIDRAADVGKVYVDGVETDSFSTTDLLNMTFGELHLGTYNKGQLKDSGEIDDYAIFDIALSSTEVAALAAKTLTPEGLPFAQWAASYSLSGTDAAFDFDADGDGGKNGYEWATGSVPNDINSIARLTIIKMNSDVVISFPRNTDAK